MLARGTDLEWIGTILPLLNLTKSVADLIARRKAARWFLGRITKNAPGASSLR